MTGSHTHSRVNHRLLPGRMTAGRWQERMFDARCRLRDAALLERVARNRGTAACRDRCKRLPGRRRNIHGAAAVRPGTPGRRGEAVKELLGPAGFPRSRVRRHRCRLSIASGVRLAGDALPCPDDGWMAVEHQGGSPYSDSDPGPAVAERSGGRWSATLATPAIADNARTDPATAVKWPARGTSRLRGEGVPGQ